MATAATYMREKIMEISQSQHTAPYYKCRGPFSNDNDFLSALVGLRERTICWTTIKMSTFNVNIFMPMSHLAGDHVRSSRQHSDSDARFLNIASARTEPINMVNDTYLFPDCPLPRMFRSLSLKISMISFSNTN